MIDLKNYYFRKVSSILSLPGTFNDLNFLKFYKKWRKKVNYNKISVAKYSLLIENEENQHWSSFFNSKKSNERKKLKMASKNFKGNLLVRAILVTVQ